MKTIKTICLVLLLLTVALSILVLIRCEIFPASRFPEQEIPESLVELMEKNPETEDFVKNYPNREEKPVDLSGYDRSQGVPLFLQWDPQWGYETYGSDLIAITGCGPTSLAMAGYYLTGDARFSPDQVAAFAENNFYYSQGNGSKWTLISEGAPRLGLRVQEIPLWETSIREELLRHHPVIVAVGPGDFTATGHFLVLTGYENGQFRLNDPNSRKNSDRFWDYEALAPQIQNLWAISAG